MSFSSVLCKLFRFLANTFEMVVSTVAQAVSVLGTAVVDVLSDLATSVGDALGIDGSTVMLIGAGLLLFFFMRKDDDKEKPSLLTRGVIT